MQCLGQEKIKSVLRAKRFQKAVGRPFFFFFYILSPKLLEKSLENHDFFLLASLPFLHLNFCPKNSWFFNFFVKKISKWEKAVGRARRTEFFFGLRSIHVLKLKSDTKLILREEVHQNNSSLLNILETSYFVSWTHGSSKRCKSKHCRICKFN